ncbi:arsenic transporter [Paeniglutamicibacter antarcticus]|uniref:Arsenic transporter n=1 Tax=Arthrobacter terrae TaxID=2935737 RepID=A0A931G6B4_9MICC|nr:SLC13 family permease [Arthrobacter terrae]MBG0740470.1 arsenic transporter [Arthrobacter terrae]
MKILRRAALPAALFLAGVGVLISGLLPWPDFVALADRTVPILLFVVAMTVVTELADEAGVFRLVTGALARLGTRPRATGTDTGAEAGTGTGRVWLLWLFVVALSTVSTVFLSLDSTAVLVTPVVVLLAIHARIPPLPFALTTVWLANTASLLLPVSNLTNLLAQQRLGLSPAAFAAMMWAPALVGVVVPAALLWITFGRRLRGAYTPADTGAAPDRLLLIVAGVAVLLLLPALVSGVPVVIPAGLAALLLLAVFGFRRRQALRWSMFPWLPLLLTSGLFLVVQTMHSHGLGALLARVSGSGEGLVPLLQLAAVGAVASNGVNNLPAYLALEPVAGSPLRLGALLIGVNLGPLISPWASLATLLWHERLKALAVNVSWGRYALAGLAAVIITLPLAVLAIWAAAGYP